MILADGALNLADEVSDLRVKFVNDAARALLQYADRAGSPVGDLGVFFGDLKVHHAVNGQITVDYSVSMDGRVVIKASTEQHLKKGDRTEPENAARIYFDTVAFPKRFENVKLPKRKSLVVVLYCGPHPKMDLDARVVVDNWPVENTENES